MKPPFLIQFDIIIFIVVQDIFSVVQDIFSVVQDIFSVVQDIFSVVQDIFSVCNLKNLLTPRYSLNTVKVGVKHQSINAQYLQVNLQWMLEMVNK